MSEAEDFKKLIRDSYESQQPEPPDADLMWEKIKVQSIKPFWKKGRFYTMFSIVVISVLLFFYLPFYAVNNGRKEKADAHTNPLNTKHSSHLSQNKNSRQQTDSIPYLSPVSPENNLFSLPVRKNILPTENIVNTSAQIASKSSTALNKSGEPGETEKPANSSPNQTPTGQISVENNLQADSNLQENNNWKVNQQEISLKDSAHQAVPSDSQIAGNKLSKKLPDNSADSRFHCFADLAFAYPLLPQKTTSYLQAGSSAALNTGLQWNRKLMFARGGFSLGYLTGSGNGIFFQDSQTIIDSTRNSGNYYKQLSAYQIQQYRIGIPLETGIRLSENQHISAGATLWIPFQNRISYTLTEHFVPFDTLSQDATEVHRNDTRQIRTPVGCNLHISYMYYKGRYYGGISGIYQLSMDFKPTSVNSVLATQKMNGTYYAGLKIGMTLEKKKPIIQK